MPDSTTAHVRWSYTAARQYATCPRQFFYQRARPVDSPTSTIDGNSGSSSVSPPGAQIGIVVHDCLEEHIARWRQGERLSLTRAQSIASSRLQDYVSEHTQTLCERYTDDPVKPDKLARTYVRSAHSHLETFYRTIWPQFKNHRYILHEETVDFEASGEPITVKPDFCTRSPDGKFVVSDWKTTTPDTLSEPTIQLLGYALWAHEEYEPDLDRIQVQFVHTRDGTHNITVPDPSELEQIRNRIQADRATWKTGKQVADFEPDPDKSKCQSCAWLTRCEAGKGVTESLN